MTKIIPLALAALAAALLIVGPAQAKEITSLRLCGPSECVTFANRGVLGGTLHAFFDLVPTGVEPSGRYFRGEVRARVEGSVTRPLVFRYDAEKNLVLPQGAATGWARMVEPPPAAVTERLAGVDPFGPGRRSEGGEREAISATAGGSDDTGFPWTTAMLVVSTSALVALILLAAARWRPSYVSRLAGAGGSTAWRRKR